MNQTVLKQTFEQKVIELKNKYQHSTHLKDGITRMPWQQNDRQFSYGLAVKQAEIEISWEKHRTIGRRETWTKS